MALGNMPEDLAVYREKLQQAVDQAVDQLSTAARSVTGEAVSGGDGASPGGDSSEKSEKDT